MFLRSALKVISSSKIWLAGVLVWAIALYILSSMSKTLPDGGPEIPHFDKFLHFTYFSIGGVLFTTWLLLKRTTRLVTPKHLLIPLAVFVVIGALDEYHQSFTPGRSGNDPYDWLADILGALCGIIIANRVHTRFRNFSSSVTKMP